MKYSAQAMVNGWIDASLGRIARISDASATIDAVRGDARSPLVTIVNWRVQGPRDRQFSAPPDTTRAATRDIAR